MDPHTLAQTAQAATDASGLYPIVSALVALITAVFSFFSARSAHAKVDALRAELVPQKIIIRDETPTKAD